MGALRCARPVQAPFRPAFAAGVSRKAHRGPTHQPLIVRASAHEETAEEFRAVAIYLADATMNNQTVGIGTGIPINEWLKEISDRLTNGRLSGVKCVPTSDVSAAEAAILGVPLTTLQDAGGAVDLLIDVADALDPDSLSYIVGQGENGPQAGQPSLPRLREVLNAAGEVVVVARKSAATGRLRGAVPVLIEAGDEWEDIAEELDDIFIGDAELRRRSTDANANPRGGNSPVITPDGHNIVDIQFSETVRLFGEEVGYDAIAAEIESVPGVVTHGLVAGVASRAVVAWGPGEEPRVLLPAVKQAED